MQQVSYDKNTNILKAIYNDLHFEIMIKDNDVKSSLFTLDILPKLILPDPTGLTNLPGLTCSAGFQYKPENQTLTIVLSISLCLPPLKPISEVHTIELNQKRSENCQTVKKEIPCKKNEYGVIFVNIHENSIEYVDHEKNTIKLYQKTPFYIHEDFKIYYFMKNWYILDNDITAEQSLANDIEAQFIEIEYIYQDIVNFFNKKYHVNNVKLLQDGSVMMMELNLQFPPNQNIFTFITDITNYERDDYTYDLIEEYKIDNKYIYLIQEFNLLKFD